MSARTKGGGRAAYRALARARPELFENPPGSVVEVLTADAEIRRAQGAAARTRRAQGLSADDLRVGVLLHDPYLLVVRDAVRFPDGTLGLYNRIVTKPNVVMLPLHAGKIALIHRFRHGTRRFHYEAPRGIAERPDDLAGDARRELLEEIGAAAGELIDLGELHPYSGICNEVMRLYLARIERPGALDRHEGITAIAAFTPAELERAITRGEITDAPTLAAVLRAKLRGLL